MEPKQNPFSVYDFLGYFVPGALFLYSLGIVSRHSQFIAELKLKFSQVTGGEPNQISFYLPFVLFAYLIGHILSLTSAFTVERFAFWCHGYPSKYLLQIQGNHSYFLSAKGNRLRWLYRVLVPVVLLPVAILEFVLGWFFSARELYVKPLDKAIRPVLQNRISDILWDRCDWDESMTLEKELSKKDNRKVEFFDPYHHDFFNIVAQFVVAERPEHLKTALNYVALYGFLRTTCLLAVIWFWVPVVQLVGVDCFMHQRLALCDVPAKLPLFYLLAVSLLAFLLFVGFVKFYRRYSQTVLLGILTIPCKTHMPMHPPHEFNSKRKREQASADEEGAT
jgi:hypothetical protein